MPVETVPLLLVNVLAVPPRTAGARLYSSTLHTVLSRSEEQAAEAVRNRYPRPADVFVQVKGSSPATEGTFVDSVRLPSMSGASFLALKGEVRPEPVRLAPAALARRPLSKVQEAVLGCLNRTGPFPGGWVWGSSSGTRRTVESLHKRDLVDLREGRYFINNAGRAAIEADVFGDTPAS